ncbi:alkaline phosphatase family protein [Hymenobacter aquaticus]|uniref:Alkaline phosphatase family protein n=1 Tax=Hymenobacter aquaticus TaxID=1867101 RepID=A0A4Z0PX00_9BACT|nr:nucleotide pyrophosphatase/phosphodiesterase family protein [Hymenobacter aquaticus]TGE22308.1 alkaline phosphatase family protein [Hymenobacter aquaticus]
MRKTVVINVVGLTPAALGENTPFLRSWAAQAAVATVGHVLPAVTCSVQATYLTGKWPSEHGIVANGWYFRDEAEPRLWRQSNHLVEAPKLWEVARAQDPSFTCANICWWYAMYSSADYTVTPRPQYLADGRKLPDCYTYPMELRPKLEAKLGTFPLFDFWGPRTSIKSSRWIAEAAMETDRLHDPTLTLVYLPHLDYNAQRYGPADARVSADLREIDAVCRDLTTYFEGRGAQVLFVSEYGIAPVSRPVHLNRVLREHGYLSIREERGLELLDAGTCRAFALADHQLAHVYVNDKNQLAAVRQLLAAVPGVEKVIGPEEKAAYHLDHSRAGELVVVAEKDAWFTYYYWLDDAKAPDFARIVDIHRKPGYDPVEMFTDPRIRFLLPKVALKVLRKKLGFRMLMDIIPLDATLVKGSHGRPPASPSEGPLLMSRNTRLLSKPQLEATEVFDVILAHLRD